MTKQENGILLRVEAKVDKLDNKFDKVMEKYIVPHDEYIKICKEREKNKNRRKELNIGRLITTSLVFIGWMITIFIAIFK